MSPTREHVHRKVCRRWGHRARSDAREGRSRSTRALVSRRDRATRQERRDGHECLQWRGFVGAVCWGRFNRRCRGLPLHKRAIRWHFLETNAQRSSAARDCGGRGPASSVAGVAHPGAGGRAGSATRESPSDSAVCAGAGATPSPIVRTSASRCPMRYRALHLAHAARRCSAVAARASQRPRPRRGRSHARADARVPDLRTSLHPT